MEIDEQVYDWDTPAEDFYPPSAYYGDGWNDDSIAESEEPQIEGQPTEGQLWRGPNRFEQMADDWIKYLLEFCSVHELRAIRWGTNKRFYNLFKVKTLHKPHWLSLRETDDILFYMYPSPEKRPMFQNLREAEFFVENRSMWYSIQPFIEQCKNNLPIQKLSVYEYQLDYALKCFSADSITSLNIVCDTKPHTNSFNFLESLRCCLQKVPNTKICGFYTSLQEFKSGVASKEDTFLEEQFFYRQPFPLLEQLIVPAARMLLIAAANFPGLLKATEYNIEWSRESPDQKFEGVQLTVELQVKPVLKRKRIEEDADELQTPIEQPCAHCRKTTLLYHTSELGPRRCLQCLFNPKVGTIQNEIGQAIDKAMVEAKKLKTDTEVEAFKPFAMRLV